MGITELLESHSQPLSNEELYDLAQQLTEQRKEDEDEEDSGTKEMQMKEVTDLLLAIDMAAEKLWDVDPDWERSCRVQRDKRDVLRSYYEIMNESEKKIKTVNVTFFIDVF